MNEMTRWLSLENFVNRVLEQWPALQLYFTEKVADKVDPFNTVKTILNAFNNNYCKAQLEFMSYQLHRVLMPAQASPVFAPRDDYVKLLFRDNPSVEIKLRWLSEVK
ncbi:hypothetical protein E2C01_056846 [Portunus trituberculatus]|uniref:Uncharacterized protein n=1 Tax=Portunus trituberculatus TaxID=210409 RepID=A0A5B7GYT1_PORTR|nr:hypothetical protein [Portunus trituberculatus]